MEQTKIEVLEVVTLGIEDKNALCCYGSTECGC